MRTSHVTRIDSGTLLDLMPPWMIVGVNVIRDAARRVVAKGEPRASNCSMIESMLSGEGTSSMANFDRWRNSTAEVSRSGS